MGLTLISRNQGTPPPRDPRVALVLAGGAITGGAFKMGGLKALDEFMVGRSVTELDCYVGASAGSFLAVAMAGGIAPDEMIGALEGKSTGIENLRPFDLYRPNAGEALDRSARFWLDVATYLPGLLVDFVRALPELPRRLGRAVRALIEEPSYAHLEEFLAALLREVAPRRPPPSLHALLPAGLFDNAALGAWLARQMDSVGMPDHFGDLYRATGRKLFISATDLDTAEAVIFGPVSDRGLRISEAVQASSALPGFIRPARFGGVDYVDGGVRRTADLDVAVDEGADLILCYNPFRPVQNAPRRVRGRHLADRGLFTVLNQSARALLHTRLDLGLEHYLRDDRFQGDIVVIEPREEDAHFFHLNPLLFGRRSEAIRYGLESVRASLTDAAERLAPVFGRYGIDFRVPRKRDRAASCA